MNSVRIYKNQITNQIYLDNKKRETILTTKYTEDDYIFIAKLICFIKKPENMELNYNKTYFSSNINHLGDGDTEQGCRCMTQKDIDFLSSRGGNHHIYD